MLAQVVDLALYLCSNKAKSVSRANSFSGSSIYSSDRLPLGTDYTNNGKTIDKFFMERFVERFLVIFRVRSAGIVKARLFQKLSGKQ